MDEYQAAIAYALRVTEECRAQIVGDPPFEEALVEDSDLSVPDPVRRASRPKQKRKPPKAPVAPRPSHSPLDYCQFHQCPMALTNRHGNHYHWYHVPGNRVYCNGLYMMSGEVDIFLTEKDREGHSPEPETPLHIQNGLRELIPEEDLPF